MTYKIVVDSSSDIPKELSAKLGIIIVPMPVYIDGNAYREGIDIQTDRFYANFKNYKELPKTSQPNPNDLKKPMKVSWLRSRNHCASPVIGLSSTYQSALMVRDMCSAPQKIT
jgi:DegV family protein with EDD domain